VMYWEPSLCLLAVGGDDGSISILKVASELNYIKFDEIIARKLHLSRIMGIYVDNITGLCYTCSEDKKFKVIDYTKKKMKL